jgi:hypothetical protein
MKYPCQKNGVFFRITGKGKLAKKCTLIVLFVKNLKLRIFGGVAQWSVRRKNPPQFWAGTFFDA